MSGNRDSFEAYRKRAGGPLNRLHQAFASQVAAAFAFEMTEADFLDRMRERRDEMLRELKAPPSWRWFKRHVLRTGDEVMVTSHELRRLLQIAEMAVPDEVDPRFLRVPLRPFADLLAKAEARHEEKLEQDIRADRP